MLKKYWDALWFQHSKNQFPLLTLPYLTGVLPVDAYGIVGYVKSIITYIELIRDIWFMLSEIKEIILKKNNQ